MNQENSNDQKQDLAKSSRLKWLAVKAISCFLWLIVFIAWLWCIGAAIFMQSLLPAWAQYGIALIVILGYPIWLFKSRSFTANKCLWTVAPLLLAIVGFILLYRTAIPTHDRSWTNGQKSLPFAEIAGDQAIVHGIRAFRYGPTNDQLNVYDDTYDLNQLETVWFGVDRFTDFQPMAHTFLSFGFAKGDHKSNYLAFSVETRRESSEELYSPLKGIYKNYEIIYVIADEQDVLSVRSDVRQHVVQLYPIKATKKQARELLVDMLQRANGIKQTPEFYHTLSNNCTNNIVYHTNKLLENPISTWQRRVIFPGYSDWLAMELGMIDTDLSLEQAREHFRIDERVKVYDGSMDFSEFIRMK